MLSGCALLADPPLPPIVTALVAPTARATVPPAHSDAALNATPTAAAVSAAPSATLPVATPLSAATDTLPACAEPAGQIISTTVPSTTYPRPVRVSIYLPPCYSQAGGPLPVIYLLHGGSSDETQWPDLNVQREADALIESGAEPFVVVMPGGVYGAYDVDYEEFVLDDLLPGIEHGFKVSQQAAGRAIGGLSLGGYWALKLAFDHPDQFAAVEGNSPVVSHGAPEDPLARARTAGGLSQLRIRLDVGDLDSLRDGTALLAQILEARGLAVTLVIGPGSHARSYWRSHTGEYLRFYLAALQPAQFPQQ